MLWVWVSLWLATPTSCTSSMYESDHEDGKPLWNGTYTDLLKRDLLSTYDKYSRPNHHANETTVYLNIEVKHVEIDEQKFLFTVNGWAQFSWKDEKMQWNTSDYGGLSVLHLGDHEIWEPDVVLYNSALGNNVDHYGNVHCLAFPDGTILWVPPSQFVVLCELDLSKWPFDQHTCKLYLGSWTHSGDQINLQLSHFAKNETDVKTEVRGEWRVLSVTKRLNVTLYSCCKEPYHRLDFSITVERRAAAYRAIVFVPVFSTVLLTLASLWLPARDRFLTSAFTGLLTTLFLIYFCVKVPVVGPHTPLIVLFFAYTLMTIATSIVMTVAFYNLSNSQILLPRVAVKILRGPFTKFLLLPTAKSKRGYIQQQGYEEETVGGAEEMREYAAEQDERTIVSKRGPQEGWVLASLAVDRLVFTTYVIIFLSFILRALL